MEEVEVPRVEQDEGDNIEYAIEVAFTTFITACNTTAGRLNRDARLPPIPFEQLTAEPEGQAFKDACQGIITKLRQIAEQMKGNTQP